jgi:hypothetical protein
MTFGTLLHDGHRHGRGVDAVPAGGVLESAAIPGVVPHLELLDPQIAVFALRVGQELAFGLALRATIAPEQGERDQGSGLCRLRRRQPEHVDGSASSAGPRRTLRFGSTSPMCEIEYIGRRTGRLIRLPVQYARDGDRLVVVAGAADTKRWWRNFTGAGQPATVTIAGCRRAGWVRVVAPIEPGYAMAVVEYGKRFRTAPGKGFRLLVIDLDGTV